MSHMDYSNLFVCLMGIGTVFIGLVCIIALVSVMSAVVQNTDRMVKPAAAAHVPAAPAPAAAPAAGEITPALLAAVSAVVAEEWGKDISAIRIVSIKKM